MLKCVHQSSFTFEMEFKIKQHRMLKIVYLVQILVLV